MPGSRSAFLISDFLVQARDMSVQLRPRKERTNAYTQTRKRPGYVSASHTQQGNNVPRNVPTFTAPQRSKTDHLGNRDKSQTAVQYSVRWQPIFNQP